MSAELVYPYRPSPGRLALYVLLVGGLGIFNLTHGADNRPGETIADLVRLNLGKATTFDLISDALLFGVAALGIYQLLVAYIKRKEVALGPSSIRLPVGLTMREITIAYPEIQSVLHQKLRSGEYLTITTRAGKQAFIASRRLPKDAFAQIRAELTARAKAAHQI